jgi:hypothetical protein
VFQVDFKWIQGPRPNSRQLFLKFQFGNQSVTSAQESSDGDVRCFILAVPFALICRRHSGNDLEMGLTPGISVDRRVVAEWDGRDSPRNASASTIQTAYRIGDSDSSDDEAHIIPVARANTVQEQKRQSRNSNKEDVEDRRDSEASTTQSTCQMHAYPHEMHEIDVCNEAV